MCNCLRFFPTRKFYTYFETSPLLMKGYKFWTMVGTYGDWVVKIFKRAPLCCDTGHLFMVVMIIFEDTGHPFIMVIFEDTGHPFIMVIFEDTVHPFIMFIFEDTGHPFRMVTSEDTGHTYNAERLPVELSLPVLAAEVCRIQTTSFRWRRGHTAPPCVNVRRYRCK